MKTRPMNITVACLIFGLIAVISTPFLPPIRASEPRLDWATVDGGGGQTRGGSYSLVSTISQADAGRLHGGSFQLDGGFWPGLSLEQSPGAPILKIRLLGTGQAVLSWPVQISGFILEQSGTLGSSWSPVLRPVQDSATEHTVTVPASGPMKCYRLKQSRP